MPLDPIGQAWQVASIEAGRASREARERDAKTFDLRFREALERFLENGANRAWLSAKLKAIGAPQKKCSECKGQGRIKGDRWDRWLETQCATCRGAGMVCP